jgi:hypothetical protein
MRWEAATPIRLGMGGGSIGDSADGRAEPPPCVIAESPEPSRQDAWRPEGGGPEVRLPFILELDGLLGVLHARSMLAETGGYYS